MRARSHHPWQGQKRSLHADTDAAVEEALIDVAWSFTGPGAILAGPPARDGALVLRAFPASPSLEPASAPTPSGRGSSAGPGRRCALAADSPEGGLPPPNPAAADSVPRGSTASVAVPRVPGPPVPAPHGVRVRRDGVRVVSRPLAMLPGVDHGPALRLDLHPVEDGIVFVSRDLELAELGDDRKGPVVTGLVPVTQLARFWPTVTHDLPVGRPVIVRLRSDGDAELLDLLRVIAPPAQHVISYRLDESPVGSQRSSYLLPDVDAAAVAATGAVRAPLEALRAAAADEDDDERRSRLHLTRRRVVRYLRRHLPETVHTLSLSDPTAAAVEDIFVDGSVLRGTRMGGAAAVAPSGAWAALPLNGATLPLEAELEALTLGHVIAVWSGEPEEPVTIHSDSRAALALLREAQRDPLTLGDARGERVRRALRRLLLATSLTRGADITVTTTWVKGHAGTPGNEFADELARSAARNAAVRIGAAEMRLRLEHLVATWEVDPQDP